ncbi:hypothetical protein JVT61DRAFT_830 [Boletus reticuloceps]|uniref:Uncharacterized protein n=1 Tax=Boletus reticuloceps TaxID=495285 RepID=A0A8I2Z0C2_9AGAM|nr:hypothetical protein JVT61DRAFT_830 [Boletus reticuloceps]
MAICQSAATLSRQDDDASPSSLSSSKGMTGVDPSLINNNNKVDLSSLFLNAFVDATPPDSPAPPRPATTTTTYSIPSNADLAAVAATVAVRCSFPAPHHPHRHTSPHLQHFLCLPSLFAPSESSSKFSLFANPSVSPTNVQDGSWDFADPDPFHFKKECSPDPPSHLEHRPAPLTLASAYAPRAPRASTHKDEWGPRTPTTPTSAVEPPPPAYLSRELHVVRLPVQAPVSLLDLVPRTSCIVYTLSAIPPRRRPCTPSQTHSDMELDPRQLDVIVMHDAAHSTVF